jgi:hypothetical protein
VADICAADGVAREDIAQPCGTLARNAKYDRSTMTVGAVWIQQAVANKSVACGTNSDDCKRGIPYCVVEDPAARGAQLRCLPSCLEAKKGPPSSTPAAARARGTCRGGAVRWVRGRRHRRRGRCRPRHCNLQRGLLPRASSTTAAGDGASPLLGSSSSSSSSGGCIIGRRDGRRSVSHSWYTMALVGRRPGRRRALARPGLLKGGYRRPSCGAGRRRGGGAAARGGGGAARRPCAAAARQRARLRNPRARARALAALAIAASRHQVCARCQRGAAG